jgi:mannose-6-phosphate isomerase-like protein (cupin superfamily)
MPAALDTHTLDTSAPWFTQVLASVAGAKLRYRVMRNTAAAFHVHEQSPECFFVLSGLLHIDTDEGTVSLSAGQFCEVRAGLRHRARAEGEATLLVLDALLPERTV